jgi:hypothetical protein
VGFTCADVQEVGVGKSLEAEEDGGRARLMKESKSSFEQKKKDLKMRKKRSKRQRR